MSERYQSLAHSKWDCKYHVVFVPKRWRKAILGNIRRQLGPVFHTLAQQKECQILEGHLRRTTCTSVSPYPQSMSAPLRPGWARPRRRYPNTSPNCRLITAMLDEPTPAKNVPPSSSWSPPWSPLRYKWFQSVAG